MDTFLLRLIEDIEQNPDDPSYAQPKSDAPKDVHAGKKPASNFDIFLSYSSLDKDEAREISDRLAEKGKRCFLAEKTLQPGDKFVDTIRDAIKGATEIWILVSPNSVRSEWVLREVAAAWALEKKIVPILLRCSARELLDVLAQTHAIDFHKIDAHIKRMS